MIMQLTPHWQILYLVIAFAASGLQLHLSLELIQIHLPQKHFLKIGAVNNNFPFSCHDNRQCLQNVGEYFDFGMGRRKVEPERRQQNSQNFFLWAHESVPSGEDGLTIYQTSFVKDLNTEGPFCRWYPKHHSEKCCTDKPVPKNKKTCSQTISVAWLYLKQLTASVLTEGCNGTGSGRIYHNREPKPPVQVREKLF
uniref:Domain of unknown function with conserved HDNR motif domain-containing protein n=1 Tax=Strix occidentalis caurina TaxID=311401 RepID=A0A8D0ENW4_STROC